MSQGMKVELRNRSIFWYTVVSVNGDMVKLNFGASDSFAGNFNIDELRVL